MVMPGEMTIDIKPNGTARISKKDREKIKIWHANNMIWDVMLFNVGFVTISGTAKVLIKMLLAAIM